MNIGLFVKDFAAGKEFSKDGLPMKSGAEFQAENYALQLIKKGHNVTIMAKKRYWFTKARENINGIDLVRLHAPFRWLEILIRLFTTHRKIDAFYIIGTPKFAVWAILYARIMHKPVTLSITIKEEIFDEKASWRNKILASCTNYIANTKEIFEGYHVIGKIDNKKIHLLAHGIDTKKYSKSNSEIKRQLRQKYGIPLKAPVVVFCARVVLRKGIDTLIKMWPIIFKEVTNAKLIVVGGGKYELLQQLKRLSKENDDSVIITGEVPKPQDYYQLSDLYVFPSRSEGLPTSLMEAMSCGLPSVVSDIGGCDDLIVNGENGFRVYSEDATGFAEKIIYLLNNEDIRQIMSISAAKYVRENCDYDQVISRLERILENK